MCVSTYIGKYSGRFSLSHLSSQNNTDNSMETSKYHQYDVIKYKIGQDVHINLL